MNKKKIVSLSLMALLLSGCQVKSSPISVKEFKKVFEENIATRAIANRDALKEGKKISIKQSLNDEENGKFETYTYDIDTSNYAKLLDKDALASGTSVKYSQGYKAGQIVKNEDGTYSENENKLKTRSTEVKLEYSGDNYSLSSVNSYYREQIAYQTVKDESGKEKVEAYSDYKQMKTNNYSASVEHILEREEEADGKTVKVRNDIEEEAIELVNSLYTFQPTRNEIVKGKENINNPLLYVEGEVYALNLSKEEQPKGIIFAELDEFGSQYYKYEIELKNDEKAKDTFKFRIGEDYYGYNELANNASKALFEEPESGNDLVVKETAKYNIYFDLQGRKIYAEKPVIKDYDFSAGKFFLRGTIASLEMNEDWENKTLVGGIDKNTNELIYTKLALVATDEFVIKAQGKDYDYSKLDEESKLIFVPRLDNHLQILFAGQYDLVIDTKAQTLHFEASVSDEDPILAVRGKVESLDLNDWLNNDNLGEHDEKAKTAIIARLELVKADEFRLAYNGFEYGYNQLSEQAKAYFEAAADNKLMVKEAGKYALCLNRNTNKLYVAEIVNTNDDAARVADAVIDIFNNKTLKVIEETLNDDNVQKEIMTTSTNYIYHSKDAVNGLQEFIINKSTFAVSAHYIRASVDSRYVIAYSLSGF